MTRRKVKTGEKSPLFEFKTQQVYFIYPFLRRVKLGKWLQRNILGDPGADSGDEGKSKRAEKYDTKKSKERREEPALLAPIWKAQCLILFAFSLHKSQVGLCGWNPFTVPGPCPPAIWLPFSRKQNSPPYLSQATHEPEYNIQ